MQAVALAPALGLTSSVLDRMPAQNVFGLGYLSFQRLLADGSSEHLAPAFASALRVPVEAQEPELARAAPYLAHEHGRLGRIEDVVGGAKAVEGDGGATVEGWQGVWAVGEASSGGLLVCFPGAGLGPVQGGVDDLDDRVDLVQGIVGEDDATTSLDVGLDLLGVCSAHRSILELGHDHGAASSASGVHVAHGGSLLASGPGDSGRTGGRASQNRGILFTPRSETQRRSSAPVEDSSRRQNQWHGRKR